ncbi:MAG: serine--tRNA ligase [Alphaproteobacteria bacterium]
MHDIRFIREQPETFDAKLARRKFEPVSATILALDEQRRAAQTEMQTLQQRRNEVSKEIGKIKREGGIADDLMAAVAEIKDKMAAAEESEKQAAAELKVVLEVLPNLPDDDTPSGTDENDNQIVREVGEKPNLVDPKEHFDLGEALGLMDFETAATISGSRFVILKGILARLERALANFMLDTHTQKFGYTEMALPALVREHVLYGTGQLPKFAEDLYRTEDDYWLIPTAEVPLTNLANGKVLDGKDLPMRVTGWTPCFRSEAGAAGKDTRGMLRQHQFSKVEMVSLVRAEESDAELERMTNCAEEILKQLGLAYRLVTLCTGDMGFSAAKTYDIEVWLPGQGMYREISSCSNCRDFQARRMGARFKDAGDKGTQFIHTLNGSGLAVGRTLIAVLENYQNEDGSITIPEVLQPYLGGLTRIEEI